MKLNINYSSPRLECRKDFFKNRVINIWNSLPASIINSSSFDRFKIALNKYNLRIHCRGRAIMSSS